MWRQMWRRLKLTHLGAGHIISPSVIQRGTKRMRRHAVKLQLANVLALFSLAILINLEAFAQQITGSITGSILDSSGAAVVNATVTLTNTGTGAALSASSGNSGDFRFLLLQPGVYALEASHTGFKTSRRDGIVVEADRSLAIPMTLNVGQVSETVEVIGGTPLLEPNTSDVGTTVDAQKIVELL